MVDLPGDGTQPFVHNDKICLKNGVYDLEAESLTPHNPETKFLLQLPVTHDPMAECPEISAWFDDILQTNEKTINLALEFIGYAMLQQITIPKMLIVVGASHTGKSTFLNLVKAFLGRENTSSVALQAIADKECRFERASLQGKLANFDFDASSRSLTDDGYVKSMTAGDPVRVEGKGMNSWDMRSYATLFAATNSLPRSNDKTDAFYERLMILPFLKAHKGQEADRDYLQRLTSPSELSGLLNKAIKAVLNLRSNRVFTETATTEQALSDYQLENDDVLNFISNHYEITHNEEDRVAESELYENFKLWFEFEKEGDRGISKTKFRKALAQLLGVKGPQRHRMPSGGRGFEWHRISPQADVDFSEYSDQKSFT